MFLSSPMKFVESLNVSDYVIPNLYFQKTSWISSKLLKSGHLFYNYLYVDPTLVIDFLLVQVHQAFEYNRLHHPREAKGRKRAENGPGAAQRG